MDQATTANRGAAAAAFRLVLGAGLLLCLAANLPGHLSVDSVIALVQARTGLRQTWAPATFSWILRGFDELLSGTGLYVTASATLLFASLMSLTGLRPRASWAAVALALGAVLIPQMLIYQGIVWRDVLFANVTLAGFVLIAHAARQWQVRRPWLTLAAAVVCLALAALVRQNGVILTLAAAAVLGWTARKGGLRAALAWGFGFLLAVGLLALAIGRIAEPAPGPAKLRPHTAALILEHYDIVGARAHDPTLRLEAIGRANPAARALLEARAAELYSPARIDTLGQDPALGRALWRTPDAAMNAQWREIVLHHPGAYLRHRADVFRWVFLTPRLEQCLPLQVGVIGPERMMADLGMATGVDAQDQALADYARRFYATPVYSHLTYAVLALAVIGLLLLRRDPADWAIVALLGGSLLFAASFAAISLACDYRYLYLLDLAAIAGVLYAALDPPWPRKAPPRPMASSRST